MSEFIVFFIYNLILIIENINIERLYNEIFFI